MQVKLLSRSVRNSNENSAIQFVIFGVKPNVIVTVQMKSFMNIAMFAAAKTLEW